MSLQPPADAPARRRQLAGAVALGAAGLAYVGLRDPHDGGTLMPKCPVHLLTGLDCPACGGLRMTHDLLNGNLAAAWADNALLLLLAPLLLVLLGKWALAWVAGRSYRIPVPLASLILLTSVCWMLARNLT